MIARTNHHLFQPLLYQVATGVLSSGEIAPATREILRRQYNVRVLGGEVIDIDLAARTVTSKSPVGALTVTYDSLVVAAGATQSYFGNDHFAEFAPGMKSIDDALELRGRIFGAFEAAELAATQGAPLEEIERLVTFVVVGAGPDRGRDGRPDRRARPAHAAQGLPRHRPARRPGGAARRGPDGAVHLRRPALRQGREGAARARRRGASSPRWSPTSTSTASRSATPTARCAGSASSCKVWAAGVAASPLARRLGEQSGAAGGPGRPRRGAARPLAARAPRGVRRRRHDDPRRPPRRRPGRDPGRQARRRRSSSDRVRRPQAGVAARHGLPATSTRARWPPSAGSRRSRASGPLRLSGFIAWLMWLVIHLLYLVGFKNRITTLLHWAVSFIGRGRSERVITPQQVLGRRMLATLGPDDPVVHSWSADGLRARQPSRVPRSAVGRCPPRSRTDAAPAARPPGTVAQPAPSSTGRPASGAGSGTSHRPGVGGEAARRPPVAPARRGVGLRHRRARCPRSRVSSTGPSRWRPPRSRRPPRRPRRRR